MRILPRTWLQFSLRAFLLLISLAAFVGGLLWIKYRDDHDYEARRDHWLSTGYKLEVEETPVWLGLHLRRKIVGLWTDDLSDFLFTHPVQLTGVESEPGLRRVCISENRLSDQECATLAALQNLEKLDLFNSDITAATLEKLSHLPKLTHLSLAQSGLLEKQGIEALNRYLTLEELSLRNCWELSATLYQLRIPTLKSLDISDCHPAVLDLSKTGLGGMPQLEILIARSCGIKNLITDHSILELRLLDLRENPLEHLEGLADAAPKLELIYVDEDDLTPSLVADIQKIKSLRQIMIGAGHRLTNFYFGKRAEVESRLADIQAKFAVSVILEDAPFAKDSREPAFNWPGHFVPEIPLIQAPNAWKK